MKWGGGVTKVKHPNKGHTPNKGQKPMYQGVRYSESPLYYAILIMTTYCNIIMIINHTDCYCVIRTSLYCCVA